MSAINGSLEIKFVSNILQCIQNKRPLFRQLVVHYLKCFLHEYNVKLYEVFYIVIKYTIPSVVYCQYNMFKVDKLCPMFR